MQSLMSNCTITRKKSSQKNRAKTYVTKKGDDMKKLVLMITTLFVLSLSASNPLRFDSIVIDTIAISLLDTDVTINILGGTAPYTYTLGALSPTSTTPFGATFSNFTFASFTPVTFTVTDSSLTVITGTVAYFSAFPDLARTYTFTYTTHPTCDNTSDGVIDLASTRLALYSINGGNQCNVVGGSLSCNVGGLGIGAPETTCTINTGGGMIIVTTPFISIDSTTIISAVPTSPTCPGDTDGSITVTATPGPTTFLKYTLTPGSLEITSNTGLATFTNLAPNSYTVTVLDTTTSCFDTAMVDVTAIDAIVFSPDSTNPTCRNQKNGTITVLESSIMGGTAPYEYSIGGEFIPADESFEDLKPDTYIVTVKDANGCLSADVMVIIGKADKIKINNVIVMDATMPMNGSITIDAEAEGATMVWYSIDGGATFQYSAVFNDFDLGKYEIVVNELDDATSKCASRTVHVRAV